MSSLRILLVEDIEEEALLILHQLRRAGYDPLWRRVDNAADLAHALQEVAWEIVTCDWVMPGFGGLEALEQIHAFDPDLPVILVSGEVREDVAVGAMRTGAVDFVSKDRLARLVPAIEREVRDAEVRRARRCAEEAERRSSRRLAAYIDVATDAIFSLDANGRVVSFNPAACALSGYSWEELSGRSALKLLAPESIAPIQEALQTIWAGGAVEQIDAEFLRKDGRRVTVEIRGRSLREDGELVETFHIARDVTAVRRTTRLLSMQCEAARLLFEAGDAPDLLPRLLETVARGGGWDVAELWQLEKGRARCVARWSKPGIELQNGALPNEIEVERDVLMRGCAGGETIWLDEASARARSAEIGAATALPATLAVPVVDAGEVVGAILCLACEPRPRETALEAQVALLGRMLGACAGKSLSKILRVKDNASQLRG
jgi:PAS domain S-box-containing protein